MSGMTPSRHDDPAGTLTGMLASSSTWRAKSNAVGMESIGVAPLPPRSAPSRAPSRLRAEIVRADAVDPVTLDAAWALFAGAYRGATRDRFVEDLAEKQRVILLRDGTGALRGFSTVHVGRVGRATVVFSGDTVIDPAHWGGKVLQRAFSMLLVREKLRRPTRPLYWFLISKGYKTYLMLAHACSRAIPRSGRPDDPVLRAVLDRVAADRFGPAYDPASGVIRHAAPREAVRPGLCPVAPALLADRDIAFFVARNPGHERGDELACLAEIRLRDPLRQIARTVRR